MPSLKASVIFKHAAHPFPSLSLRFQSAPQSKRREKSTLSNTFVHGVEERLSLEGARCAVCCSALLRLGPGGDVLLLLLSLLMSLLVLSLLLLGFLSRAGSAGKCIVYLVVGVKSSYAVSSEVFGRAKRGWSSEGGTMVCGFCLGGVASEWMTRRRVLGGVLGTAKRAGSVAGSSCMGNGGEGWEAA